MNEDDLSNQNPSEEGLRRDLAKVMTVGVGRPIRKPDGPIRDLELVAARLADRSFPPLRQVEELLRKAIEHFGTHGEFGERMALLYGVHEDTKRERKITKRRLAAAVASSDPDGEPVSIATVERSESQIQTALAQHLLKRYGEAGGVVAEPEAKPDNGTGDAVEPRGADNRNQVAAATDDLSAPTESTVSAPVVIEREEAEPAADTLTATVVASTPDDTQPAEQANAPAPDDAETANGETATTQPAEALRRLLLTAIGVAAISGAIAGLLLASGHGAAHHRQSTASLPVPVTTAPFWPVRPTYDYDLYDPSNNNCDDPNNPGRHFGRCGALSGHVLNSFINTPSPNYGDERYFFDARFGNARNNTNTDPLTGVKVGETVVLRTYVDNDTAVDPNDPEASDTRNTRVRVNLAATSVDPLAPHEWVLQPQAFISASNAQAVEDGVNLIGPEPFALQYEPGSAVLLRNNASYPLSDTIVSHAGAPIGLLYMNGDLPAGNNFDAAALIELRARVVEVAPPEVRIIAQVRLGGSRTWHSVVHAKPGNDVQWLLNTSNGPWSTVNHVITRDVLPPHLALDEKSVAFTNARGNEPLAPGPLFSGGYDNGTYNPGDNTLITFTTKVLGNFRGCQVIARNQGFARSDQTPVEVTSDADVVITKSGCAE